MLNLILNIHWLRYVDLLSWLLNKRRSDQGKGSGILFTKNYIILAVQKRKITYSSTFSRAEMF